MENNKRRRVEDAEINLLYIAAMAMERIIDDIEKRLNVRKGSFHRERKMRFSSMMDSIKNVKRLNDLIDQIDYGQALEGNYEAYQYFQEDAYELARVLLLFADRHTKDPDVGNKVSKYLRSMEGSGIINEEVLERFYLKS